MGEEEPAEDAVVAAVESCDANEQLFNSDANADVKDDDSALPSLLIESLPWVPREPARLAAGAGAAKLTCGKWCVQSASNHCGILGPIN